MGERSRFGPFSPPRALDPWQNAQLMPKVCFPRAIAAGSPGGRGKSGPATAGGFDSGFVASLTPSACAAVDPQQAAASATTPNAACKRLLIKGIDPGRVIGGVS